MLIDDLVDQEIPGPIGPGPRSLLSGAGFRNRLFLALVVLVPLTFRALKLGVYVSVGLLQVLLNDCRSRRLHHRDVQFGQTKCQPVLHLCDCLFKARKVDRRGYRLKYMVEYRKAEFLCDFADSQRLIEELEAAGMPTCKTIANRGGISKSVVSDAMRGLRIHSARTVLGVRTGLDRDTELLMLERERLLRLEATDERFQLAPPVRSRRRSSGARSPPTYPCGRHART